MGNYSDDDNNVGGVFDNMFPRRRRNDNNRYDHNDYNDSYNDSTVAGAFDDDDYGIFNNDAFCRAVRRCLIRDLLAAENDDNNHNKKRRKKRHRY